jgi:hypothetical protein
LLGVKCFAASTERDVAANGRFEKPRPTAPGRKRQFTLGMRSRSGGLVCLASIGLR